MLGDLRAYRPAIHSWGPGADELEHMLRQAPKIIDILTSQPASQPADRTANWQPLKL
jgi:hypothetical protein